MPSNTHRNVLKYLAPILYRCKLLKLKRLPPLGVSLAKTPSGVILLVWSQWMSDSWMIGNRKMLGCSSVKSSDEPRIYF